MNFLEQNQKQEIRAKISEDIILYEPSFEQIEELKNILKENLIVDENLNATGEISYKYIRWIVRELCANGAFVDEYDDDKLAELFNNGNRNIKLLLNEIVNLISEIGEDMLIEQANMINTYSQMATIMSNAKDQDTMKNKFNKLFKKNGFDVTFEDLEKGDITPEMLQNKRKKTKK